MAKKRNNKKKRRSKHPSSRVPAGRQILAGCYIDFEGFAGNEHRTSPPPVLIGMYRGGEFKQIVFTACYRWAAEDPGVDHDVSLRLDRDAFIEELVDSAGMNKPLFAYSEYELRVIEKCVGHRITRRYRNVRSIAKTWLNKQAGRYPTPTTFALVDVAESMGIALNLKLPEGGVTSRLREVRDFSSSSKRWSSAPAKIRNKWREVLEHNRSDVTAIREMMMHMRQIDDE